MNTGRGGKGRSPSWNIVRSLFPHVEPFQRQDRNSCVVRREELFTLDKLKRAGGRFKANTALGIDGLLNEILKEERASSASRMTHFSCALLTTSGL